MAQKRDLSQISSNSLNFLLQLLIMCLLHPMIMMKFLLRGPPYHKNFFTATAIFFGATVVQKLYKTWVALHFRLNRLVSTFQLITSSDNQMTP